MVTVGDIIQALEEVAPLSLQESYDNAGLLTGVCDMEARAALVCVDVTEEVIDDACRKVPTSLSRTILLCSSR